MSDSPSVTHESLIGQKYLRDLSRFLRMRRRFSDQLNEEGLFLIDSFISRSVAHCNRVGLGEKAREILVQAEFENAQLPLIDLLGNLDLEEVLLQRLVRVGSLLENSTARRNKAKRTLLELALQSTLKDLASLGLEDEARKTLRRSRRRAQKHNRARKLAEKFRLFSAKT